MRVAKLEHLTLMSHLGKQSPPSCQKGSIGLLGGQLEWNHPSGFPLRIPLLPTDCKGNITWHSFLPRHLHAKMLDSPLLTLHVFCEAIQSCGVDYPGNSHSHCKEIGTFTV